MSRVFRPQPAADVERALLPAIPVPAKSRLRCASCALNRQCVSKSPALCESCATSLESNLSHLGLRVLPAARALALRCLQLPPQERAPVLAVLAQLGLAPYHVTIDYPQLEVLPDANGLRVVSRRARLDAQARFESWSEVIDYARKCKAAIRWPLASVAGDIPIRFEHLIGLSQPPLVWCGCPLQLDIIEERPNVAVLRLHAGDQRALVPDVLRYVLTASLYNSTIAIAPGGDLIVTRRYEAMRRRDFEQVVEVLCNFRLISTANAARIAARFPYDFNAPRKPHPDLERALEYLSPHESYTFGADSPYETMRCLAPALLTIGLNTRYGSTGMTFEDERERVLVHPWAARLRRKTLRDVVEQAHASLQ